MKSLKIAFAAVGITLSLFSYGQTDSTKGVPPVTAPAEKTESAPLKTFPAPNAGSHYIAVLGYYNSTATDNAENRRITIAVDEQNPGKIWIEGLADQKLYALRKPAAGTYKIPAQKADDKSFPEGTLIYDDTNKQINICVGCKFMDENPAEAFNTSTEANTAAAHTDKAKAKQKDRSTTISFTGQKADAGTALKINNIPDQLIKRQDLYKTHYTSIAFFINCQMGHIKV